ncbi:histidine--tRNA ligase [Tunicatimonas pelagia]|uniref:histidine--tRNA ligase n=1 Tax=Tunicatimonas pelagia TaxID=931531 RepID=UPI0026671B10|nr:histidine--tRNA ligase [Tunicatimonas pelagia]WKN44047.1 histidine--tRNA ligase [Tunicatimonas pelagia]
MSNKPTLPKGTRDFGPRQMAQRTYILDTIRTVFQKFGFQPLETPSLENLSVLTGKYGDEGDQLLFKILDNGNFLAKTTDTDYQQGVSAILPKIAGKGLRYDLTVPFARYVVMNQHEITFPFKRYQIQPVWRADRPQKGRYREFYQCDADVVGTDSLLCEAEIIRMLEEAFGQLGIEKYTINLNHRQILNGLVEVIGAQGKETDLLVAIDKLDKIGKEKVIGELQERGFSDESIQKIAPIFDLEGSTSEKLSTAQEIVRDSETGQRGIAELQEILALAQSLGSTLSHIRFDLTLARGLSYYTGTIFEVKVQDATISSSISGGGRYDNLTGVFGLPGVSGVGISFGVDRIYDVMEDLGLFPTESQTGTQVLVINFDKELQSQVLPVLSQLRSEGIRAEMYPEAVKLKKQFGYADKKGIPYALVIGTNELESGEYSLKNFRNGEQQSLSLEAIIEHLRVTPNRADR